VTTPKPDERPEAQPRSPGLHSWKLVLFPALAVVLASAAIKVRDVPVESPAAIAPIAEPVLDSAAPAAPAPAAAKPAAPASAAPRTAEAANDRVFPVAAHELSSVISRFGDSRDGGRRSHLGIDIAAPRGTAVVAVGNGRVEKVEIGGAGGRAVWVNEDGSGRHHYFAHLETIAVTRGQRVRAGQTIGTVGTSGNAAGSTPHLHYAVRDGSDMLDPTFLFRDQDSPADSAGAARVMRTRLAGAALKARPGGATIAVLSANQRVTVQSESGRFYRVRYRGKTGYIAQWLLKS
jgi:murein DD-endopeptidase MepM/ murein hydrolase activator NlpD